MQVFEQNAIKGISLPNRFVRSATWEGLADSQGLVSDQLTELLVRLGKGDIALIITGHAFVSAQGRARRKQLGVFDDSCLPGLSGLVEKVHETGAKIILQISHAGVQAASEFSGESPLGASAIQLDNGSWCREMDQTDIDKIIADFIYAAMRAQKSGFDGIQLHAAHHYLLAQFLSPHFNKRQDRYGGTIENRVRIVIEILRGIKTVLGTDFPVFIKLNSEDFLNDGLTREDMLAAAILLEKNGIDVIELSGGTKYSGDKIPSRINPESNVANKAYYEEAAKSFKRKCRVPLILVGGIRSLITAEKLIENGTTDYISLARPLIREPDLIKKWKHQTSTQASCISCNRCFEPLLAGEGLYCKIDPLHIA